MASRFWAGAAAACGNRTPAVWPDLDELVRLLNERLLLSSIHVQRGSPARQIVNGSWVRCAHPRLDPGAGRLIRSDHENSRRLPTGDGLAEHGKNPCNFLGAVDFHRELQRPNARCLALHFQSPPFHAPARSHEIGDRQACQRQRSGFRALYRPTLPDPCSQSAVKHNHMVETQAAKAGRFFEQKTGRETFVNEHERALTQIGPAFDGEGRQV